MERGIESATDRLTRSIVGAPRSPGTALMVIAPRTARIERIAVWILALYVILKMFYIFSGGSIQPADAMLGASALMLVNPGSLIRFLREQVFLTAMVVWIAIVNIGWFAVTGKLNFLPSILYYAFNLVIVVGAFSARVKQPVLFDKIVPVAIMVAIVLQAAVVVIEGSSAGIRSYGTFRNPNQLAYWGVCVLSVLLIVRQNKPRLIDLPFIGLVIFCEFASASRAGLASTMFLMLLWLYLLLQTPVKRLIGLSLAIVAAAALMSSPAVNHFAVFEEQDSAIGKRMAAEERESQFEERNYDRIIDYYQYTILGAGEGYLSRFQESNQKQGMEIHSSFGTMLFSYGVPGLLFFMAFLAAFFTRLPFQLSIYMVPAILYGITHQGLRFSFFWIMLGVLLSAAKAYRDTHPIVSPRARPWTRRARVARTA